MEKLAIETIERHQMIAPGDGIVVGLSGGADSTALLLLLCALKEKYQLKLHAVHINHQLRGEEANRDEAFSKALCQKLGVSFCAVNYDVSKIASEKGISFEMAGRELRYDFFESQRQSLGFQKIAVAHHRDDQGETMLLRMIRGSGLDGLLGIRPSREGIIIRPLLMCSRKEIEAYCKAQDIQPMMDHTNLDSTYSRNFLRNEIIPAIDTHFGGSLNKQLSKTAELLAEDADFIQIQVEQFWENNVEVVTEGYRIARDALRQCHPAIKNRLVRQLYAGVKGNLKDLEQSHVNTILELIDLKGNKRFEMKGIRFYTTYEWLYTAASEHRKEIDVLSEKEINEIIPKLSVETVDLSIFKGIKKGKSNSLEIYIDGETVKGHLRLRHRKAGDKIVPMGMRGHKKLKDLLIDEKVPQEARDRIWLICDDEKIIWVYGIRQHDETKVTKNTRQILKLWLPDVVTRF